MTTKPTFIAYTVKNRGKGQTAIWTRIGACWPLAKRTGFTIELDAFPVDGRLVLIEPDADQADPAATESGAA